MWNVTFPFQPVSAPRPSVRRNTGDSNNSGKRISTYYDEKYLDYLNKIKNYLEDNELLNEEFYSIINSPMGAILEIDFFYQIPKSYKQVYNIMKTTAPDLDNLVKSTMDGIFNISSIRDSHITGLIAFKYNVADEGKTVVRLKRYSEFEWDASEGLEGEIWEATFDFKPIATPRPKTKFIGNGIITYYPKEYNEYLEKIKKTLKNRDLVNEHLKKIMKAPMGVIAQIDYFYQVRKDKRKLDSLMRTSQPDIDNLIKGTLDGIFNKEIGIKDSRVVGLIAFKYNTFEKSKTNVRLQEMG
ncbi:TPA: RusA family crossover junction endodeoxyribonuclease [Enterococcus faecium]|nr:RusA family crossover junction endodeoxyribonuclease [Enterococcus faecium]